MNGRHAHISAILLLLILTVSVTLTGASGLLQASLFEVGTLWVRAAQDLSGRLTSVLTTMPDVGSVCSYVLMAAVLPVLYFCYVIGFRSLNRVRKLGDVGYIPEGVLSVKETANYVQKRRKIGDIPPVYPNGWFGLVESDKLKKGEAITVSAVGQNLAVFRDESGTAHVLDAYCPHMGANLAAGGRVVGDCLECPFHAWQFRGFDGKCVQIPYTEKIPDFAKIKSWPCTEVTGWVFFWHHAEGVDPTWQVPSIDEIESGKWVCRGRTEHHINAHIEEIPENGADVVHLSQVHGPIMMAGIDLRTMWSKWWSFANHSWTAAWEQCPEPDGHVGQMNLVHKIFVFGYNLSIVNLNVQVKQIGPGIVYLTFDSVFGRGCFTQTVTPQSPLLQKVVHHIYFNKWMIPLVPKFFLLSEALQVERDIMIWNNKQYEARPMFVKSKEDALIAKHRRWYSQFYSENSPRIFKKEGLDF
uniref:cholesterol 7-desaturase n=1 Tax=Biomphalaria glabrata TaxID=6526 RepID=A0A2C9JQQ1_BIOGL